MFNYLKTFRRRAGFSQEQLSLLLGYQDRSCISKYENSALEPNLSTLIAYQVIFQTDLQELFPDLYQKVEGEVLQRVQTLIDTLVLEEVSPMQERRLSILREAL